MKSLEEYKAALKQDFDVFMLDIDGGYAMDYKGNEIVDFLIRWYVDKGAVPAPASA